MNVLQGLWEYLYREDRLLVALIEVRGDQIVERRDRMGEWGSGVKVGRNLIGGVLEFYVSCYLPAFAVGVCSVVFSYSKMLLKGVMLACYAGGNLFYTPSNVLERHTHHAQPFQTIASNYLFLFASFTIRGCL